MKIQKIIEIKEALDFMAKTGDVSKIALDNLTTGLEELDEQFSLYVVVTRLKDKEAVSFDEWKKENVKEKNVCNEYLYKYGGWFDADDLLSMYKKDISL